MENNNLRKPNEWLEFIKVFKLKHGDKTYKEILKLARSEYKIKTNRKTNKWLEFIKEFRKNHPELQYKDILKQAKLQYTPIEKPPKLKRV